MPKCILLGIDINISSTTQLAISAVCELMQEADLPVRLLLLHVIPHVLLTDTHPGSYPGQTLPIAPTMTQLLEAEEVLHKARLLLQKQGVALEQTKGIVRVGTTAEEIVKVAREQHVSMIAIGSHNNTWKFRLRRLFLGSTSLRVLQLASCPVLIAKPPLRSPKGKTQDLVSWYTQAITQFLNNNAQAFTIFTPEQVAQQFPPLAKEPTGQNEIKAAGQALEQLAQDGLLCRNEIKGEVRYFND